MKSPQVNGGFFVVLGINLVFNLEWTIPAWILLAAHFIFKISIWWFIAALILWILGVAVKTAVLSWLVSAGNIPDKPRENKNPYSQTNYKPQHKQGGDANEKS